MALALALCYMIILFSLSDLQFVPVSFDKSILKQFLFVYLKDFLLRVELLRACSFLLLWWLEVFYFDLSTAWLSLRLVVGCWILSFLDISLGTLNDGM